MTGDQFLQFHRDLSNVIRAGAPLQITDGDRSRSIEQSLQQLEFQQKLAEQYLNRWAELRKQEGVSRRYLAALQIYDLTGNLFIVLDGLTRGHAAREEVKKVLRWPLIYLMLVVTLAVVGFFFFKSSFVPVINEFRQDIRIEREYNPGAMDYSGLRFIASGLIFSGLLGFLLIGIFRLFNYLAMTVGGHQFVQSSLAAQAGRTIDLLLSHQVANEQAIELACHLVGLTHVGRDNNLVVQPIAREGRDNNPVLRQPPAIDQSTSSSPSSSPTTTHQTHDWVSWTQLWSNNAQRQLNKLRFTFPSILILAVGGIVVLGYGFLIYGTVLLIYDDLLGEFR